MLILLLPKEDGVASTWDANHFQHVARAKKLMMVLPGL